MTDISRNRKVDGFQRSESYQMLTLAACFQDAGIVQGFRWKTTSSSKGRSSSFHSKEMVIGHRAGISRNTEIEILHCSKTYTIRYTCDYSFRRLSHGYSPSGLSHEYPLITQLAWPCLYSSNFLNCQKSSYSKNSNRSLWP